MEDSSRVVELFDERARQRSERREFFRILATGAAAAGSVGLTATAAVAQSTISEADVLNFALNLEYLEAQFYYQAAFGQPLPNSSLTGTGTQGAATGGRQVQFTDQSVALYAREIASDERAHVEFLRTALGGSAVSQPRIDIGTDPNGAFSSAARAAGLVGQGQSFDPYASDEAFLLGAFIFEDVGVTAYKGGASALINNKVFLEAAAGILAVEAYHAAIVRTTLYAKGISTSPPPTLDLVGATEAISNARDSLDGADDRDQGVRPIGTASNIVPLDGDGLAYTRSPGQVLNIVYLNRASVTAGGFFPNGMNGTIRTSAAS
ncbi:hypothetical protein GGR88_000714 [Sphingomonas jejuensis]|uniref:Ferritin-like domain-containing protein n=1 Tax=Sphingomonas jejuensis TaxID=904715 RepID=A0ABX0XJ27_9SPHN|nr:ferritin-like domain-containing protein [Sphingomonas jejuensis]NJC33240.1 hypothetical protein [Sphingomonas jejuensis]